MAVHQPLKEAYGVVLDLEMLVLLEEVGRVGVGVCQR